MRLTLATLVLLAVTGTAMADDRFVCTLRAEPGLPDTDLAAKLAFDETDMGANDRFDLNLVVVKDGGAQNAYYTLLSRDELPDDLQDATFAVVEPKAITAAMLLADDDIEMSLFIEAGKDFGDLDFGNPVISLGEGVDSGEGTFDFNDDVTVDATCVRNF